MGTIFPISSSMKQKLNTRSSTESEIVGVDDFMPSNLWTRNFLNAQDYDVTGKIIFQDNNSAILLEKNGKSSSGKKPKKLNIRYFFVTDRIKKGEVMVDWCPNYDMAVKFFTKPNQGLLFRQFRDMIMVVVRQSDPGKSKNLDRKRLFTCLET